MSKNCNASKIIGIQFSILSPEEIRNGSVAEITNRDTYINNKPVIGGLFDPRMGVLEPGLICPTDGLDYMQTPGYFGHIDLARPVFYIQYLTTIIKILRCTCIKCSKLLISKEKYNELLVQLPDQRWNHVFALASKIKRCGEDIDDGCGCKQPNKIKKENLATLIAEWDNVNGIKTDESTKLSIKLTPEKVIKLFKRISDDDIKFMGFSPLWSRPEWMICQVLAVPPPAVRPSVKHDSQQRSEDDITHIIVNIIKTNKTLQEKIGQNVNANIIDDWTTVLQYYIATLVDNKIPGVAAVAQRSGRPLKSIKERLNGKGGRVRGNLMGKRVDYSARSVITPDPQLSIRELGVPLKIAKNLTKPVTVNKHNLPYLLKLVRNGPDVYPGAKILEKKTGENISLRYIDRDSIKLKIGDIVHRHMMDGDPILFNRQPTLHRMSMMCHIVKIMPIGDTFRMNVGDTKPYNADFDGDEMNLHMPQDEQSEIELLELAYVPTQIISPANNKSIIGIFQDSLLGCYIFTNKLKQFSSRYAMNLLMGLDTVNINKLPSNSSTISNFGILTQILPSISLEYKTKKYNDNEEYNSSNNVLQIKNGKYIRGQIEKGVLGDGSRGLIQRIFNDYGSMASSHFIDDLQNIITEYMKTNAYSVGISDLIANKLTNDAIAEVITNKKRDVQNLIDETHLGIFENKSGKTNLAEFEVKVNNILNKASLEAGKLGRDNLSKDNRFVTMVNAGSKGSDLNIAQMISCLGQQNVDGKRIPYGFDNRTLPHFHKYDDSPNARGFIESSFIGGLSPTELFFHAMGGRVGLIDTAVKSVTWETPIVIIEKNEPLYTRIGEWIDHKMINNVDVEHHDERNLELMNTNNIYIPTTDENGIVTWGEITAITRHDPGNKLYEIKTEGGRVVIVTESKSLLIWNNKTKKLKEMLTPDIRTGDYVPVTQKLCSPSIIKDHISLTKYLPKDTYLYGTDFNKAHRMMNDAMINCSKIPTNWWENNNNNEFTLPYTKKCLLQRCIHRSNIDNINDGFVYPYNAIRKVTYIPEIFKLTKDNGIFIGLFLAEGNVNNAHICITNNSPEIRTFVKNWFDKYSIVWNEKTRKNNANGITTTITACCSILSTFITKLVGSGSKNKYVPNEAFTAPEEFIIGLLNGYFSGDGYISNNSVEASSASKRLIEGINMLCSRFGIFGKVFTTQVTSNNFGTENILPAHRISIRAQWGKLFSQNIELLNNDKNRKLQNAKWTNVHRNFPTYNDVVLDKIKEIKIIGVENHPKMYDLTIPSTLNFGLANGLQVRDTSQTGYIQRRLIKALEDLVVHYDMTVRNNKSKIIQFSYGDDCFDPIKVESQTLPLVQMSLEEVYNYFQISNSNATGKESIIQNIFIKSTQSKYKQQKFLLNEKTKKYIDYMLDEKKNIINNVFKNIYNKQVYLPVAFYHIIQNIIGQHKLNINSQIDITPLEAYDMIEKTYDYLESLNYIKPNMLFKVMYYFYLAPKQLLIIKRFNKNALTCLLETVVSMYKQAIVNPGESVGMIAAQSIGEPTTQLTLNTFHFAGVASKSNVTRGVPRIEEILSLSENPKNPSCTVYLQKEDEGDQGRAQKILHTIEHTKLRDIVKTVTICFDPDDLETLIDEDRVVMEQYKEFSNLISDCIENTQADEKLKSKWIIRMEMNQIEMLDKSITMDDVHFALKLAYPNEITCVYSDYNSDKLIFRIRLNTIIQNRKKAITQNPLDQSDEIYLLKNYQNELLNNLILRGVNKIANVLLRKITDSLEETDDNYNKKEIWVLDTVGTNLIALLALDNIDKNSTITNDIQEIYRTLGIEAARQSIYNELTEVIEFDSTYINYHHLNILCDRMTCNSTLVSVFRHGINNDNIGPIAKASFEETPEQFLKAARHGELDNLRGVSANVMCGQEGFFGTNCFQLLLDLNKLTERDEDSVLEDKDDELLIEKEFGDIIDPNDPCSVNKIAVQSNVNNIKLVDLGNDNDYDPFA